MDSDFNEFMMRIAKQDGMNEANSAWRTRMINIMRYLSKESKKHKNDRSLEAFLALENAFDYVMDVLEESYKE